MNVITATEFRKHQRKYFELAESEPVFITRTGKPPIALTPVDLNCVLEEEVVGATEDGDKRNSEEK